MPQDFQYSNGWINNFKKRFGIKRYAINGESGGISQESIANESLKIQNMLKEFELDNIYNMDETGLFYRMLPDKTLSASKNPHGTKKAKERITVALCCNASGTDKRKLLVIGKNKKPRCFKNFDPSLYCTYRSNNKS